MARPDVLLHLPAHRAVPPPPVGPARRPARRAVGHWPGRRRRRRHVLRAARRQPADQGVGAHPELRDARRHRSRLLHGGDAGGGAPPADVRRRPLRLPAQLRLPLRRAARAHRRRVPAVRLGQAVGPHAHLRRAAPAARADGHADHRPGTAQCSAIRYGTMRCDAMRCDAMRCDAVRCGAM